MTTGSNRFSDTSLGVDVVLDEGILANSPNCPHGPTLLFERYFRGEKSGRRFYACSACRDRKDCDFFQYEDEKVSDIRQEARLQHNQARQPPFNHAEYYQRYRDVLKLPSSRRQYCRDCSLLLSQEETRTAHRNHRLITGLSDEQLQKPSHLLDPLENKKTNAQYLYNQNAVRFLVSTIQRMGFSRVLCIGTPRLHEMIMNLKANIEDSRLESLLLDIDHRYYQFYLPKHFCRYNMFNHHFFDGEESRKHYEEFLHKDDGQGIVMVTDPPFGGLVEVLAFTVKRIMGLWKEGTTESCSREELPVIWTFPYFLEFRILESLPSFHMSDYKVGYDNHSLFQCNKTNKGSPVRHFTNVPPKEFILPLEEGYRFCEKCERYVSSVNVHCVKCNRCTSKDGRSYVHCDQCNRCVKPGRVHCESCNQCELPDHVCAINKSVIGCHVCGDPSHKRRQCPQNKRDKLPKRKRKHQMSSQSNILDTNVQMPDHSCKKMKVTQSEQHSEIERTGKQKRREKNYKKTKKKFSRKQKMK